MNEVAAASVLTTAVTLELMAIKAIGRADIAGINPAEAPGASSSVPAAGVTTTTTTATTAVRIDKDPAFSTASMPPSSAASVATYHGVEPRSKPSAQRNV